MYDHQLLEKKWQTRWTESGLYRTGEDSTRPKYYVLDMFPYPSGVGLHVGHPKGYIATDILARYKMLSGYNVLHPMGFDAFGLPAENYAIKTKTHPRIATENNVANYKRQLSLLGFSYDWEREVNTTDPEYYRWTQWIFLQLFKRGLAFESKAPINWCPSCKTGLANEDLEDGKCERCGTPVEQKPLRQWVLKITAYADRLLDDLETLPHWEESVKEMQRNWIGRSIGAEVDFAIKDSAEKIPVFTTRIDTIFGCTYVVLAPENPLVEKFLEKVENREEVLAYIEECRHKTELQRTDLNKDKTGVKLEGLKAINPFNNEEIAIFLGDYVLNTYATGAVMAVPAHDERDFAFAKKYGLEIRRSIASTTDANPAEELTEAFTEYGCLVDSGEWTGLESAAAKEKMAAWLEAEGKGRKTVNFKIKDWVFSRQRYWGEPIPLIHCPHCGVVPVPESELPLRLPEVESYEPTDTGESPLAAITDWVNTACPVCGGPAKRETNTMPQWAGSCWYYLRYIDPRNDQVLVSKDKEKYWSPVDVYVGGAEHATRHLIYARFWHKFLYDIGAVFQPEPFSCLQHVGLIMGEDGRKMSKRWGNVVNPDEIVVKYGADALRVYEMFMGPFDQACNWNTNGLIGARKFLEKVAALAEGVVFTEDNGKNGARTLLHKTIRKIGRDIESFSFNTAVSALMIMANRLTDDREKDGRLPLSANEFHSFLILLAPFAPHLAEELFATTGGTDSVFRAAWPEFNEEMARDDEISLAVQVNGKLRVTIPVSPEIAEADALALARENEAVSRWLEGKEIIKHIFVPGKLLNIVIK